MTETLFRGQRTDNGKWVEGDLLHETWIGGEKFMKAAIRWRDNKGIYSMPVEVDPETVGQYIGQTDKNEVKIFSGSRIKYTAHPGYLLPSFEGVVGYDEEYAAFGVVFDDEYDAFGFEPKLGILHFSKIDCIREDFLNHCEVVAQYGSIMEDFKFTTKEPLATNEATMDWFSNEHFYKVFDEDAIFVEDDGSYAEVLDGKGKKWALHASGDGDFTHHKIRFEALS